MTSTTDTGGARRLTLSLGELGPGPLLLLLNCILAVTVFWEGFEQLVEAWQLAEYSHGPLIPVLSGVLFLRQLKTIEVREVSTRDRLPGLAVLLLAVALGLLGKLAQIPDIVTYSIIVWVAAILLMSFGWRTGKNFWSSVLHLVFMLPLPGLLYWKVSIWLRSVAAEFGVWLVKLANVPVFLDGNIIDLGVTQLHVADACSGLRYLVPIMSFSYIFATLYRGPVWHKIVLLLAAAPLAVFMNSVRIGMVGVMVNHFGLEHAMGFSHFMEGWVIFIACILMLFGLAKLMLMLQRTEMPLSVALDLDTTGLGPQIARVRNFRASPVMLTGTALMALTAVVWLALPQRAAVEIKREPLAAIPTVMGGWEMVSRGTLSPLVEEGLGADDYVSAYYLPVGTDRSDQSAMPVELFVAWYADQTKGGIHSPEVCLPAGGFEIADLTKPDVSAAAGIDEPLPVNRALIEKGHEQHLVYYWFEQYGGRTAHDLTAKFNLLRDAVVLGRSDGALVRLTTRVHGPNGVAEAEARLSAMLERLMPRIHRYVPRQSAVSPAG
ncbi:MAG: VPLPA-CTERM-specific exosortase XrtD [Pseudomonadota bacterium]